MVVCLGRESGQARAPLRTSRLRAGSLQCDHVQTLRHLTNCVCWLHMQGRAVAAVPAHHACD